MTCTHGAPHMTHAPGARCPWCQHTIATDDVPRTVVNVARDTGTDQRANASGSRVATIAPEVCGPPVPATSGVPVARATDPQPAWNAAADAKSAAARNRVRCIMAHANAGDNGLTGDELERETGVAYETIGPRRPWLEDNGFLVAAGTRPNNGGRSVGVYVITAEGRRMVADLRAAGWLDDGTRAEVAA